MAWLEMSRNPDKRPADWKVGDCLWSPRLKEGGAKWGFWETMLDVQPGDVVFHLCGQSGKAAFASFSTAASSCISINEGPSGKADLYRIELKNNKKLDTPILLTDIFREHNLSLRNYFVKNSKNILSKERLFYVIQNNRLQCLNGAYLSELSQDLLKIIFNISLQSNKKTISAVASSTATGTALKEAAVRIGHHNFARNVKNNYRHRCAFPGCPVDDLRFLIGSHIARWTDAENFRGETNNGLSLCTQHDKAFEIGAFTVAPNHTIVLNPTVISDSWLSQLLSPFSGQPLLKGEISPSVEALKHHWIAHGYTFNS